MRHSSQASALGFEPSRAESRQKQLPFWRATVKNGLQGGQYVGEGKVDYPVIALHLMVEKFAWKGDIRVWASRRRRRKKRRSHGQTGQREV